jgi:hypothetical protein
MPIAKRVWVGCWVGWGIGGRGFGIVGNFSLLRDEVV